jgi:16S rRNA (uracil1498-N3)-methyltransferase
MLRLYVPGRRASDGTVRIAGPERRHLRTLRLGAGDRLRIFDDDGNEHEVLLERVTTREAVGRIVATIAGSHESALELVLVPALVKHDKMDWVVEKVTELGVARIAPAITRYTVVASGAVERWRRIALAAAKQCGRTRIPTVDVPRPVAELWAAEWPGRRLVAWEDEAAVRLADLPASVAAVTIAIGPEGGFHPDEVAAARTAGFATVTLGRRVLRAETAAVVAVALCQHRWGDG